MNIPNMVEAAHKRFGMGLTIMHLTDDGPEELDAVGIKPEGGIAHIRTVVITASGKAVSTAFRQEVVRVPLQLLLITDAHGMDVTKDFLIFALEICDAQ